MDLREIDLNLLWALDALLRERNVTRAAESLELGQPAMSMALRRLRRLTGDELLVRVGSTYYLTPLAMELAGPVQEVLHQLHDAFERRPRFDPRSDERTFIVAASDYAVLFVIKPLVEHLSNLGARIGIEIRPLSETTHRDLERSEIDLLIFPPIAGPDLPNEPLLTDRWVCAVWKDHPQVGDSLELDQYLKLPHAAYGRSLTQLIGLAEPPFETTNRRVQVAAWSFFTLPFLLRGTSLVALLHERLGRLLADAAEIKLLDPPFETAPMTEAMFWHPRHTTDPAHAWLRTQIRDAVQAGRCDNITNVDELHIKKQFER